MSLFCKVHKSVADHTLNQADITGENINLQKQLFQQVDR